MRPAFVPLTTHVGSTWAGSGLCMGKKWAAHIGPSTAPFTTSIQVLCGMPMWDPYGTFLHMMTGVWGHELKVEPPWSSRELEEYC